MMVVAQVSLVPTGTCSAGISDYVVAALKVLDNYPDLQYRLTPMGTIIEADIDEVWAVVREMHEACFRAGAPRVVMDLRVDDRRDKPLSMDGKLRSVLEKRPETRTGA